MNTSRVLFRKTFYNRPRYVFCGRTVLRSAQYTGPVSWAL